MRALISDGTATTRTAPSGGGYASLTGPGETATPGDLTQEGGFHVVVPVGDTMGFTVGTGSAHPTLVGGIQIVDGTIDGLFIQQVADGGILIQDSPAAGPRSPSGGIEISEWGNGGIDISQTGSGAITISNLGAGTDLTGILIQDATDGGITVKETGPGGLVMHDLGGGGLLIEEHGGGITIQEDGPGGGIGISNNGTGSIGLTDSTSGFGINLTKHGAGGITIQDTGLGGVLIETNGTLDLLGGGGGLGVAGGGNTNQFFYFATSLGFLNGPPLVQRGWGFTSDGHIYFWDGTSWNLKV